MKNNLICPKCSKDLATKNVKGGGVVFLCKNKHGLALSQIVLRKFYPKNAGLRIWLHALKSRNNIGQACPSCQKAMINFKHQFNEKETDLDICKSCAIIWFDEGEYKSVLKSEQAHSEQHNLDHSKKPLLNKSTTIPKGISKKKGQVAGDETDKLDFNQSIEKSAGFDPRGVAFLLTIVDLFISYRISLKEPNLEKYFMISQAYKTIGAFILILFHNYLPNFVKHGTWGLILDKASIRTLDYFLYFGAWFSLIAMPFYLFYKY